MHKKNIVTSGPDPGKAAATLVMIHGRGGSAQDILGLAAHLSVDDYSRLAPQATNNTWYPFSFLAPPGENEPWLSSALDLLTDIVKDINNAGVDDNRIFFLGFSQGACLTLEFVTRNARRWGGVVAFTGGLIGDKIYRENYAGDFLETPVYIGTSDPDSHVPVERVHHTGEILTAMNAKVTVDVFPGMGHTISEEEIEQANRLVFGGKVA